MLDDVFGTVLWLRRLCVLGWGGNRNWPIDSGREILPTEVDTALSEVFISKLFRAEIGTALCFQNLHIFQFTQFF